MTHTQEILTCKLRAERYLILVSIRPVAPARATWNRALQGVIDALAPLGLIDDTTQFKADLWLEEGIGD